MATATEISFALSVAAAESARQTTVAKAFATWNYQQGAPLTTYRNALAAAASTYHAAVATAATAANFDSNVSGFSLVPSQWAVLNNGP
jgi:hypothetical protein